MSVIISKTASVKEIISNTKRLAQSFTLVRIILQYVAICLSTNCHQINQVMPCHCHEIIKLMATVAKTPSLLFISSDCHHVAICLSQTSRSVTRQLPTQLPTLSPPTSRPPAGCRTEPPADCSAGQQVPPLQEGEKQLQQLIGEGGHIGSQAGGRGWIFRGRG